MPEYTSPHDLNGNISVWGSSSCSTVKFQGRLYTFYNGSGQDGIFGCIKNEKDDNWGEIWSLPKQGAKGMSVSENTGPAAVVFHNRLYVFFHGSGGDGIFHTYLDDVVQNRWSEIYHAVKDDFDRNSSPTATVFNRNGVEELWLCWHKSSSYSIRFAYSDDIKGYGWYGPADAAIPNLSMLKGSSPSIVTFQSKIYLFFSGSGKDGIFYTSYDGKSWQSVTSLGSRIGNGIFGRSSPAASVSETGVELVLTWSGSGSDGSYFCFTQDGDAWYRSGSLRNSIDGPQHLMVDTSPCAIYYSGSLYFLWVNAADGELWASRTQSFNMDNEDEQTASFTAIDRGQALTVTSSDPSVIQFWLDRISMSAEPAPFPGLIFDPRKRQPGANIQKFINLVASKSLENAPVVGLMIVSLLIAVMKFNYRIDVVWKDVCEFRLRPASDTKDHTKDGL